MPVTGTSRDFTRGALSQGAFLTGCYLEPSMVDGPYTCPVCEREVTRVSDHHLIPRSRGGKQEHTLPICNDCHNAIHAFFTNVELERSFHTVDALLGDERFAKHVRFLKRQSPDRRMRTRTVKGKRKRGKRR